MAKAMLAKFPAKCSKCGGRIEPGAVIVYDSKAPKGRKTSHWVCPTTTTAAAPAPAPQPEPAPTKPAPVNIQKADRLLVSQFDSLSHMMETAATPCRRQINEERRQKTTWNKTDNEAWFGVASGSLGVETLTRNGWPEGVTRMLEALDGIGAQIAPPVNIRRCLVHGDYGDEYDIHAANMGAFDRAWTRRDRRARTAPQQVRIISNTVAHLKEEADAIFWTGAAVLKLADMLTAAGYAVRIDTATASESIDESREVDAIIRTTVKDYNAPLDLNALAISICLAGFYRLFNFQTRTHLCESVGRNVRAHMGTPARYADLMPLEPGDILAEHIRDAEAARAWIENQISKLEAPRLAA